MAILVAIEGADGAGKNTTARRLCERLEAAGRSATLIAFPRYGETVGGITVGRFLAGELPVALTPEATAVLYALDRFESKPVVEAAAAAHHVVVFDRYIASNIAYQAAKADDPAAMIAWILALETGQFAMPPATLTIYLDTPWDLARDMILRKRQRSYTDRSFDEHEADAPLQQRVRANYARMAAENMGGPWHTVTTSVGGALRTTDAIVDDILAAMPGA